MTQKKQRHPGKGGAGESTSKNKRASDSTADFTKPLHGPVKVGLGYEVTFYAPGPAVDGVSTVEADWSPTVPKGRDMNRIHDRYLVEFDRFSKKLLVLNDDNGSVVFGEMPQ